MLILIVIAFVYLVLGFGVFYWLFLKLFYLFELLLSIVFKRTSLAFCLLQFGLACYDFSISKVNNGK